MSEVLAQLEKKGGGGSDFLEPREYFTWTAQNKGVGHGYYTSGTTVNGLTGYGTSMMVCVRDISGRITINTSGTPSIALYGLVGDTMTLIGNALGAQLANVSFSDYECLICTIGRSSEFPLAFIITEN